MRVVKLNDSYVLADAPWCYHRRSKNYAALITGLDPRFGFKRSFLKKGFDNQYIFDEKPKAGDIIEVQAIYFTGGGHGQTRDGSGFYRLESDGSFTSVDPDEVKKAFSKIETETF
jgi:hypothetical protein